MLVLSLWFPRRCDGGVLHLVPLRLGLDLRHRLLAVVVVVPVGVVAGSVSAEDAFLGFS